MATNDAYSRLVAVLKVVLPLVALAILSTLFLLARGTEPDRAIPYSRRGVEIGPDDRIVSRAAYSGVTRGGDALTITAASARPRADGSAEGQALEAVLEAVEGGRITVTAPKGRFDETGLTARLSGGVDLTSSTGWAVASDAFTTDLGTGAVESGGAVTADGPAGRLAAGRMRYVPGSGDRNLLLFEDGVRLVYQPETRR
jgi:lipopolysaccharide export system protein LptC